MKALYLALPAALAALPAQAHPGLLPHAEPHGAEIVAGLVVFAALALFAAWRGQGPERS